MTEKAELASYLCNLLTIMESKEDAALHRGMTLANEYNLCYDQLIAQIKDDNETRNRKDDPKDGNKRGSQESLPFSSESVGLARRPIAPAVQREDGGVGTKSILNEP